MRYLLFIVSILFFSSCSNEELQSTINEDNTTNPNNQVIEDDCENSLREIGRIYENNSRTFLWGGNDSSSHFNITDWSLDECSLHFGLGREYFQALLSPNYAPISLDIDKYPPEMNCIVLKENNGFKIYPYSELTYYEVINETTDDGTPVMIAYCILADLGVIYSRKYCDIELTFGVSGYTYFEDETWGGVDAFLLWDRDTESLWWPLNDSAVSGVLKDTKLEKHNDELWSIEEWSDIVNKYPDGLVLTSDQFQAPPENWPEIPRGSLDCN